VLYIRNATPQFLETVLAVQRTAEKQRFVIVSPVTFITGRCYIYKDVNNCIIVFDLTCLELELHSNALEANMLSITSLIQLDHICGYCGTNQIIATLHLTMTIMCPSGVTTCGLLFQ
jgi:hypothetical protein